MEKRLQDPIVEFLSRHCSLGRVRERMETDTALCAAIYLPKILFLAMPSRASRLILP